jgi:hypothetical protein
MRMVSALRILIFLTLSSLYLFSSCASQSTQTGQPQLSMAELKAVPVQVEHSGQTYQLETYLWRDFMPMAPPGGKGLVAIARLVEVESKPISQGTTLDYLWVIHGDEVWATEFSDESRPSGPAFKQEAVARDGPQWEPNVEVEVVVGWHDSTGGFHLVRAAGQKIHRTD